MSNYFDNQTKWAWENDGEKVVVTTEHNHPKPHTHTMDITDVPIGEMVANPGKVMGDAHRSVPHEFKDGTKKTPSNNNDNVGKDANTMSSKGHQAFVESLNPANYSNNYGPQNTNSKSSPKPSSNDGGREIGDEGPGSLGREPNLKGGNSSDNNVASMRASIKSSSNANSVKGQLSQNGQNVNNSGKTATPNVTGKSSSTGTTSGKSGSGHSSSSNASGGHNGSSSGGHGGSGGGHGGSGGGHGGSGGGHGGSGGSSGGGHGGSSGGGHGGH